MILTLPLWVVITVCLADAPKDCREVVLDKPVSTQTACLVEGTIVGTTYVKEHEGWQIQEILCTQEEPKDEEPA